MNPLQLSLRTIKKKLLLLARNTRYVVFLIVFSLIVTQPHHFVVEVPNRNMINSVHASYEQLLQQTRSSYEGALLFENISIANDGTSITYVVKAGDTLSNIAKEFGTTVTDLAETNQINIDKAIKPGTKLIIAFTDNFVYEVTVDSTLEQFANKYGLDIHDLMNLNYLTPPSVEITIGQELILPLTRAEAVKKGLATPEEFVPLELNTHEQEQVEKIVDEEESVIQGEKEKKPKRTRRVDIAYQEVVTPEETERRLQSWKKAQEEKQKEATEPQKEQNNTIAHDETPPQQKTEPEQQANTSENKSKTNTQSTKTEEVCNENQCYFEGKCRTKPANARCAPEDSNNARVCDDGFRESGKLCVKPKDKEVRITKISANELVSQRYFNARKTDYPYNGWARGQCTEYVDYRRWKNLGKQTFWRGNAKARYTNASKAGASVGAEPRYGAAAVFLAGTNQYRGYGHVAVVLEVKGDMMLVEEQNYVGPYIVSQRRVSVSDAIGFIYP